MEIEIVNNRKAIVSDGQFKMVAEVSLCSLLVEKDNEVSFLLHREIDKAIEFIKYEHSIIRPLIVTS